MSNRLEPNQARYFVGPDLGPVCLQNLSADDTREIKRVKNFSFDQSLLHKYNIIEVGSDSKS